jgi:hypothetical protein
MLLGVIRRKTFLSSSDVLGIGLGLVLVDTSSSDNAVS